MAEILRVGKSFVGMSRLKRALRRARYALPVTFEIKAQFTVRTSVEVKEAIEAISSSCYLREKRCKNDCQCAFLEHRSSSSCLFFFNLIRVF